VYETFSLRRHVAARLLQRLQHLQQQLKAS
jgi:hypothetical protein